MLYKLYLDPRAIQIAAVIETILSPKSEKNDARSLGMIAIRNTEDPHMKQLATTIISETNELTHPVIEQLLTGPNAFDRTSIPDIEDKIIMGDL